MSDASPELLPGKWDDATLTDRLLAPVFQPSKLIGWLMLPALAGTGMLFAAVGYTFLVGLGAWGNNIPVAWAFAIINFVWWIGIGHAGTFISAVLLLFEQRWRTSLNRIAEGMTLFALVQAGMMPILHLGRPWFFYWLVPYPATMRLWPQFMSTLTWDVAAVSTYTIVSILFWYLGLIPDLAAARDRAKTPRRRRVYGFFALGWRGAASHWRHYRVAQLLLAGLATPLVLSVHSIVSMDFAIAKLPGWHSPIFPPYFVAGAIFSGFAMVVTLLLPLRKLYHLEHVVTARHLDLMAKLILVTGSIVAYSYAAEAFVAWQSGDPYERHITLVTRPFGPYAPVYWLTIACNVVLPQFLWFKKLRRNALALWIISVFVQIGMWSERFVLIVTSEHQDWLPSSWAMYRPSVIDGAILFGTISFFLLLFLIMIRFVPFLPIAEQKELLAELRHDAERATDSKKEVTRAAGAVG
ncbi:MAG TPA: NrfD/PsrC family molybdoenzyme membrane anchor subunit [Polyangiaceae bacterium]|nr:NrfD/PsrC family molybdoenzyme membrane anchor subunit [Polyangiaceae bacterium]